MKKIYLIATLLLCCLNSCIPPKKQSSEWKAKHVILIGIDAWGAYSMNKANIPNIRSLMADGSYNLKKRSVLPSSSAPNWASMYTPHWKLSAPRRMVLHGG